MIVAVQHGGRVVGVLQFGVEAHDAHETAQHGEEAELSQFPQGPHDAGRVAEAAQLVDVPWAECDANTSPDARYKQKGQRHMALVQAPDFDEDTDPKELDAAEHKHRVAERQR